MKTSNELFKFARSTCENTAIKYVYGMKGAVMTESKYNQLKSMYPSYVPDSDKNKIGFVCTDCSGLISMCTGIVRGSSSFKSTATRILAIDKINEAVPGCAVWKSGHIGVYLGYNTVAEAKSSASNLVISKLSDTKWTHILWLCDIDYTNAVEEPKATEDNDLIYTVVKGDTLSKIAKSFDTTITAIAELNNITDVNKIKTGQKLNIPSNTENTNDIIVNTINRPDTGDYKLLANMRVRKGPSTSSETKTVSELTADGKKNATSTNSTALAVLRAGTIVTVKSVYGDDNSYWGKIPSGYICLLDNSTKYTEKV